VSHKREAFSMDFGETIIEIVREHYLLLAFVLGFVIVYWLFDAYMGERLGAKRGK
jgi:hypothetical protein